VFQLRFHMPFYALRKCQQTSSVGEEVEFPKPHRDWRDISFMDESMGIHESHMAFTVCGVADRRWTAYAFTDNDYDEDRQISEHECDYECVFADQIATNGARIIDANRPIWDPREYYLTVVSGKVNQIVGEWAKLIRKFEKPNSTHTDWPPSIRTPAKSPEDNEDVMVTFDRTQKTLLILGDLHSALSATNEAWDRFSSATGDIEYFRHFTNVQEVSQRQYRRLLHDLKGKFHQSKTLQRRLDTLSRRYKRSANILALRLTLDSNNTAKWSGSIAELMVTWVSPFVLVSALFAIPEPFGNFHRTEASFAGGFVIVFALMHLLVFFTKRNVEARRLWTATKDSIGPFPWNRPQHPDMKGASRKKRTHRRADTDATLVGTELDSIDP
jgi:hypothetical protein